MSLATVAEKIRTIRSLRPEEVRSDVLNNLQALGLSDFAATYTLRRGEFGPTLTGQSYGSALGEKAVHLANAFFSSERGRSYRHRMRAVPEREQARFVSVAKTAPGRDLEPYFYRDFWDPLGIQDLARMVIAETGTFVAWVGLARTSETSSFLRSELATLNTLAPSIRAALLAARRLEGPDGPADFVCYPNGGVERCSPAGKGRLRSTPFREALGSHIRAVHNGARTSTLFGYNVRVVRLEGEDGMRYLASLVPLRPETMSVLTALTHRQQETCRLAATGASSDEIASILGVSRETVRSHLRAAFAATGVSNRVELARAIFEE